MPVVPAVALTDGFIGVTERIGVVDVAAQLAVVPPFDPLQLHVQEPLLHITEVAIPELHRFVAWRYCEGSII